MCFFELLWSSQIKFCNFHAIPMDNKGNYVTLSSASTSAPSELCRHRLEQERVIKNALVASEAGSALSCESIIPAHMETCKHALKSF
jgi:hypothetical protein